MILDKLRIRYLLLNTIKRIAWSLHIQNQFWFKVTRVEQRSGSGPDSARCMKPIIQFKDSIPPTN